MNIFSQYNKITWKVVRWYAEHDAGRWIPMWELLIKELEEHPLSNFLDGIYYIRRNHNKYGAQHVEKKLRHTMREAVTLANKRKKRGNWRKCIDDIFNDIQV